MSTSYNYDNNDADDGSDDDVDEMILMIGDDDS